MAMSNYIRFLFLSIVVAISVVSPQKLFENGLKFNLKEKLIIGSNESVWLLNARAIVQSNDGSLFISDKLGYSVKKLDSKGKKLIEIGGRGGGKGEFRGPDALDIFKNYIAIADFASPRIQIFTTELNHLRTLYVKGSVFDIAFDRDGNLWVGTMIGKKEVILHKYNLDGKQLKSIKLKNSTGNEYEFEGIFHFIVTSSNKIIVAHSLMNKIEIWDTAGKFLKEFTVEDLIPKSPKKLLSSGLFSKTYVPEGNILWDVAVDSKENIYVQGADYSLNPYRDIYVYNIDGKFMGGFTLPAKSSYIWINRSDELFTIESKGTLIKKYSLK